jgi:peptidoglycan/xylan/chitin deacetylase (PgdA/CDA1 family)
MRSPLTKLMVVGASAVLGFGVSMAAQATSDAAGNAPDLTISASHEPSHFIPGMLAAYSTLTVTNSGDRVTTDPVTVTAKSPAGFKETFAGGDGWSCSGNATVTCTRGDALPPGAVFPSIEILGNVAKDAPAAITITAQVSGGGDVSTSNNSTSDRVPARDACPYGWSPEQTVSFAPPFRPGRPGGIDSGVRNPELPDGCTLLDVIWRAGPFKSHANFTSTVQNAAGQFTREGLLTQRQENAVLSAAKRSDVGKPSDHSITNSCSKRIALTFHDGPSSYRPQLLRVLRDKQVHATFWDLGVRAQANPQWPRYQVHEGHVELSHAFNHIHMDELTPTADKFEVEHNEYVLATIGAPLTFKGIRPPFGGSNPEVQKLLLSMGYMYSLNQVEASDWIPVKPAAAITHDIMRKLYPGAIIGLHDGPIDTTAGAQTIKAVGQIIDQARQRGYCFGTVDHTGQVVADRYVPSKEPIPPLVNPVPYHIPLAFGSQKDIPQPWVRIPSPIQISASHSPSHFVQGQQGDRLILSVANQSNDLTDGNTVTVTDRIPSGLSATSARGQGWACQGTTTVICTRADVLTPQSAYPPIVVTVNVAGNAATKIRNVPKLVGHGEMWTDAVTDRIVVQKAGT